MENYYNSKGKLLLTEFEMSNIIHHRGSKGTSREYILIKYLQDLLPFRFGVGKGEIRSHNGEVSEECDLIIYDKLCGNPLFYVKICQEIIDSIFNVICLQDLLSET